MYKGEFSLSTMLDASRVYAVALLLLAWVGMSLSSVKAADIIAEGGCTLSQAIESANQDRAVGGCVAGNGADNIELASDITLTAELPAITSPISIMGGGFAINGENRFRIFFVDEDGDLSIESLTLRNGAAQAEARICIDWDPGEWTAGGAICNLGALSVSASRFSGNGAEFGGAIASVGAVTINYSDFGGNTARSGGALINWIDGKMTIEGGIFSGNTATRDESLLDPDSKEDSEKTLAENPIYFDGDGGAIANALRGEISITGSEFSDNEADLAAGAILNHGNLEILGSQFANNSAYGGGGAFLSGENTLTTVTDSSFNGNSTWLGGAIESWGILLIVDSRFHDNFAVRGGAIRVTGQSTVSITGSRFSDNSASDSGGAIFNCVYCELTAVDSVFSGNSARLRGGAIFGYGTVSISGGIFSRNRAGDLGGAIINLGTLQLTDSEFTLNRAVKGGGIYNDRDNVVEQDNNYYSDNRGGDCTRCD